MGHGKNQDKILKLLGKYNKRWFTQKQIQDVLDITHQASIHSALSILVKSGKVQSKLIDGLIRFKIKGEENE